jgi:hypothetical protein
MSERKVLNKYYPPDFDAAKLPRVKREKNRQFTIRLMAPFNMRCKTCGEYIYRGKKFNARKEDVIGQLYLGIQIYRFYIKCTKCLAEITFLTNPAGQDYEMENGAIRNFECIRLAEKLAEDEAKHEKEEEANNPMKLLENRTRDSRREMAILESLEDLKELNSKNATYDPLTLIKVNEEYEKQLLKLQEEEDEAEIQRLFKRNKSEKLSEDEEEIKEVILKKPKIDNSVKKEETVINKNISNKSAKSNLSSLIIRKKDNSVENKPETNNDSKGLLNLCAYSDDSDES